MRMRTKAAVAAAATAGALILGASAANASGNDLADISSPTSTSWHT